MSFPYHCTHERDARATGGIAHLAHGLEARGTLWHRKAARGHHGLLPL